MRWWTTSLSRPGTCDAGTHAGYSGSGRTYNGRNPGAKSSIVVIAGELQNSQNLSQDTQNWGTKEGGQGVLGLAKVQLMRDLNYSQ